MWRCHTAAEAFFQVLNYSPVNLWCEIQMLRYCPGFRQCLIPFCVTAGSLHQPSFISNHSEVMDYYSYSPHSSSRRARDSQCSACTSPTAPAARSTPSGHPSAARRMSICFPALSLWKHSGRKNHKQRHLSAFAGGVALHIELSGCDCFIRRSWVTSATLTSLGEQRERVLQALPQRR